LLYVSVPNLIAGITLLGYVAFNFVNGGMYKRGKGLVPKEEFHLTFYAVQGIIGIAAIAQFVQVAVRLFV
jgi:hypothetical protein